MTKGPHTGQEGTVETRKPPQRYGADEPGYHVLVAGGKYLTMPWDVVERI